ncbi:MAG: GAF domain-containing protein, partial [Deltaproteobacteria bacterium]
ALGTHLAKVMELQSDGTTMLVRAGVGWKSDVVGIAKVRAGERTAEHYALQTVEPVVSPNIATESRFDYPDFIRDNGVQALATVIIMGSHSHQPYGVLQVDSREPRAFTHDDMQFLRDYANLLAAAVERLRIVAELRERADEKARLLQELQHRVKNNLQTVMTLVGRAMRRAKNPEVVSALRGVGDGIEALRLIHEKIYSLEGGGDRMCLGTYLAELVASMLNFHGKEVSAQIRLVTDIQRIEVAADTAVPFGLITSEFITNSLKYAFGGGAGTMGLKVENTGTGQVRITLWDDGQGLPAERSTGTGIRLIDGLARQAGATPTWSGDKGTCLVLTMPTPHSPPAPVPAMAKDAAFVPRLV